MTPAPSGLGVVVSMPGGGYAPVCLACPVPVRVRVRTRLRSGSLVALSIHHDAAHGGSDDDH